MLTICIIMACVAWLAALYVERILRDSDDPVSDPDEWDAGMFLRMWPDAGWQRRFDRTR